MDKKKFIPIVLVIAIISYFGYKQIMAKETNENVYYGTVEAETINVASETMGKISEIEVEEGQRVKAGELIASLAGDESRIRLDLANITYKNALEQVNLAKSQLDASKAQLKAAKEKLNLLVNGATERTKLSAKLNLESAEKSTELSKINYDKNNIVAPVDGVVETVNFNKGEFVNVGSPIATILDMNNVYVKIFVPEKALPKIKLGQDVTLKSDFIKDKTIKGKVVYISPEAEFTPMNIVTNEDRTKLVFEVKIKIMDNLDVVRPGMLMDVVLD